MTSVEAERLTRRVLEGTSQGQETGWRKGEKRCQKSDYQNLEPRKQEDIFFLRIV